MAKRGRKPKSAQGDDYKTLLATLTHSIRREVVRDLDVVVRQVSESVRRLEQAIAGKSTVRRGRKPGRKPGRVKPLATHKPVRRGRRKGNAPRGALAAAVMGVLQSANKPLAMKDIHAAVMKTEHFVGRNAKSVYNKISGDLNKSPRIKRVGKGTYALK